MPPPITTTSKWRPAMASTAAARVSTGPALVEEDGGLGECGPRRGGALRARPAEVQQRDEALLRRQADRDPALLSPQQPRGSPVAGEAAGVGGEQDDVGGDGGRVQVLLVGDRVAAEE